MKERPWFQFHLSTLVVLTFVAGLFMGIDFALYDYLAHSCRGRYAGVWRFFAIYVQAPLLLVIWARLEDKAQAEDHSKELRKPFTEDELREIHERHERRKATTRQEPPPPT